MFPKFKSIKIFYWCLALLFVLIPNISSAQTLEQSLIKDMKWRNIGPANPGGRISDVEALENDYTTVFVAVGNGGVWKSTNAGTTWKPIFDNYGTSSIGDIAIFQPNPNIVWVGTGEEASRNSVAWGDGIYKSTDGGMTFKNMGLMSTQTIGKVLTHPSNPDIVYVAAMGHNWGYNNERGLYKTTNGGKSWTLLGQKNGLPEDGKTGAIDMVMHPKNPDIIYVSCWEKIRFPHRFLSGGSNGGIFKTTNGGNSFTKLRKGLPKGDTGKIGLAISLSNPDVLMAIVESETQPSKTNTNDDPDKPDIPNRPNPDFYDLSILGSGIYRSENGGSSWKFMNRSNLRPFYYSHIYMNPLDDNLVYSLDASFNFSKDKGKTFEHLGENIYLREDTPFGVHGDHHAMWFDPNDKNRFYIGDDGGLSLTHDHENFILFNNFVIAQTYAVGVDMDEPYNVIGGFQDGQTWRGPSNSRDRAILSDHWFKFGTGDGFYSQADPEHPEIIYYDHQGAALMRVNVETGEGDYIKPYKENISNYDEYISEDMEQTQNDKGWYDAFRFNWNSPFVISPHNSKTIYLGGNHLFKTVDRGDKWRIISYDLTKNDPDRTRRESGGLTSDVTSAENHGTITTLSVSELAAGLVWIGTDDGNVQLTRDDGNEWEDVTYNIPDIPENLWVSRVEASHFSKGTAYVSFDGHRSDNFSPWIFKTENFGRDWMRINANIPEGSPVYVVKEDLKNPNLLFAGTEFAVYFSVTGGDRWAKLNMNMPTVAVHDLAIHPRDGDLIAGTHGRGLWVLDDITALQQSTPEVLGEDTYLFDSRIGTKWASKRRGGNMGNFYFEAENSPRGMAVNFYLIDQAKVTIRISDISGELKLLRSGSYGAGINRLMWDMRFDPSERRVKNYIKSTRESLEEHLRHEKYVNGPKIKPYLQRLAAIEAGMGLSSEDSKEGEKIVSWSGLGVGSLQELTKLTEELVEKFGGSRRNFGSIRLPGFSVRGLQGPEAPAGKYIINMVINGVDHLKTVTVRNDPKVKK